MKLAFLLGIVGLALTLVTYGLLVLTIGGPCRVQSCPPSSTEIAFYAGLALVGASTIRIAWVVAQRMRTR